MTSRNTYNTLLQSIAIIEERTRMKKTLFAALVASIISCTPSEKPYTVSGKVDSSFNGKIAYLKDYNHNERIVDSARVENGQFCFTGTMRGDSLYRLTLGRLFANVIVEGGTDVVADFKIHGAIGSEKNRILNAYEAAEEASFTKDMKVNAQLLADTTLTQEERTLKRSLYFSQRRTERMQSVKRQIKEHNNDAVGAYILWNYLNSNILSPEEFDTIYEVAGDYLRGFAPIQKVVERMTKIRHTSAGMPFTDFTIENGNMDGSTAKLSDYVGRGKYIFLDFWASWCIPCREEIPFIQKTWNHFKGDRFEVVSIAVRDSREATERAIRELNLPWPQILNAQSVPMDLYGFNAIPFTLLIGPDGTIIQRDLHGDSIYDVVKEVLEKDE